MPEFIVDKLKFNGDTYLLQDSQSGYATSIKIDDLYYPTDATGVIDLSGAISGGGLQNLVDGSQSGSIYQIHATPSLDPLPEDSVAFGIGTTSAFIAQTTIGTYNALDTAPSEPVHDGGLGYGNYAFIVGNGTSDSARSNALTVDWEGNIDAHFFNNMTGGLNNPASGSAYKQPWFNWYDEDTGDTYNMGFSYNGTWTFNLSIKRAGSSAWNPIASWRAIT